MGPEYEGPVKVQRMAEGVYLLSPASPDDAPPWQCVDCSYTDTERSLICPNCATDGELMGGTDAD